MIDYLNRYEADANGCWNYTGTRNPKGYGQILQTTAHRYFYTHLVGPIPEGLTIDHLCRNTSCVNPAHLEPVTLSENLRRRHALTTHCRRGHRYSEANTYRRPLGTKECRVCRYDRWVSSLGRPVLPVGRPRVSAVNS